MTKECVELGLEQVKPWTPIGNMGSAVHKHAVENGYTVVREIGGHGVGLEFHEDPWVSYTSKEGSGVLMVPGMIFTIEPMVNMGSDESIQMRSMTGQCGQRMDCHRHSGRSWSLSQKQDMRSFAGKSPRKSGKKSPCNEKLSSV